MKRTLVALARVLGVVVRIALALAAIGLVAMTAMIAWQIYGRYIQNDTPSWTEALSVLVMAWFIFLGAAVGVRENFHMGFDVLVHVLPRGAQPVLQTVSDLAILAFGLGMAWYGAELARRTWTDHLPGLGIARGIGYVPLAVGGVLVSLFVLERLARRFAGLSDNPDAIPDDAGTVAGHEA